MGTRSCHWQVGRGQANPTLWGAPLAPRWFRTHQGTTSAWLTAGKVLVIEGQAAYHRPMQEAYDGVLGGDLLQLDNSVAGHSPTEGSADGGRTPPRLAEQASEGTTAQAMV